MRAAETGRPRSSVARRPATSAGPARPRGPTPRPIRRAVTARDELSPLFRAKARPPQLPDQLLDRPRLMGALRQACRRRLVVVRSPGGSGKTTSLTRFAEALPDPPGWYTVDDLDRDAVAFLYGLSLALGCPPTERPSGDPLVQLSRVVGALERLSPRALLIVDDVHRLAEPDAIRALSDLIRYLPRGASLILSGREMPELLIPALDWCTARQQLTTLTWESLRLSEEEREAAASLFHKDGASSWILAWSADTVGDVGRYLRREIVNALPEQQVDLLGRLSVLPSFDVNLAAAMADGFPGDVPGLLDGIARDTPLLDRTRDGVYRFGESARDIFSDLLSPAARAAALRTAGRALRTIDPVRSAECFAEAEDWGEVARSLAAVPLLDWFRQTLTPPHQLLDQVPEVNLIAYPQLVLARAWAESVWQQKPREALQFLAREALFAPGDVSPAWGFWRHYIIARGHLTLGDVAAADSVRASMRAMATAVRRDRSSDPQMVARCLGGLAIVERSLGDSRAAIEAAEQGLVIGGLGQTTTREEQLVLLQVLANISYLDGDYDRAQEHLVAALKLAQGPGETAQRVMFIHLQAGIAQGRGEYTRALGLLEQALSEPILPLREKAMLTLQTAHILLDLGDFRGAGQRYRTVASWFREPDRDWCFSRSLAGLAICCSLLGLFDEAESTIARLRGFGTGALGYDLALAEGIFALQRKDGAAAVEHFEAATVEADGTLGGRRDFWLATFLRAQAFMCRGQKDEAERIVQSAQPRCDGRPIPALPVWVVQPVQDLLDRLPERPGDSGLLPAKPGQSENPSPRLRHAMAVVDRPVGTQARQVEIRLFGPPRVVLDGNDVAWPSGLRRKSIELFWYAALHPEGFTRDQAQADLFAEHDEVRGRRVASVAIAELRRALADILRVPGHRVLARNAGRAFVLRLDEVAACVRIDTRDLADLADELRASRRRPPPTTVPEYFRGELVAGLTAEWIEPVRRYWSAVYLRTLATLAARYAKRGELQQAIRCHELALAVDPTIESSHATLMRLFHAAGDRQALEAQMWLYKHVACDELGLEPDDAVQELYERLTTSNP